MLSATLKASFLFYFCSFFLHGCQMLSATRWERWALGTANRFSIFYFVFFLLQVLDAQRSTLGEVGFGDGEPFTYQGAEG